MTLTDFFYILDCSVDTVSLYTILVLKLASMHGFPYYISSCENSPLCGAENVSLMVSVELLGFTSSGGLLSIILYGGGGVSAEMPIADHRHWINGGK